MQKTMNRSYPPWMFTAAISAGVAAYVFLIFLPNERATAKLRDDLEQMRLFVAESGHVEAQIATAQRQLERTQAFGDHWRQAAPDETRLAHVFVTVTEGAEAAGVQIVRFEPQPAQRMAMLDRVPVEMACEGSYHELHAFLASLESLAADFWIDSLKLEPVTNGETRLRGEFQLVFFAGQWKDSD